MIGLCFRRQRLSVAALALLSATACGSETVDTVDAAARAAPTSELQTGRAPGGKDAATAHDHAGQTMTENDRLLLGMAENACEAVDFPTFFRAFSGSWAVRAKYTADSVTQGTAGKSRAVSRREYLALNDFPVAPMDYDFVTAASAAAFDAKPGASWHDLSYVALEFNTANDNRRRVDWLPGVFEKHQTPPPPDLEEGLGAMVRATGGGGTLLFFPTATCWELVQDVRNPMPRP